MSASGFYTLLTRIGIAKFVAARASGNGVNVKSFKLSSQVILPSEDMESLGEVVYEALINNKYIDAQNTNYVNLECHIPANVGGFEVNAIGIYDDEGALLAVGNLPRTYKPLLSEGSAKELMIRVVMELSNASEVILKLNPSLVMASRDYVNEIETRLSNSLTQLGSSLDGKEDKGVAATLDADLENKLSGQINGKENKGVAATLDAALEKRINDKIKSMANLSQLKLVTEVRAGTEWWSETMRYRYLWITDVNGRIISNEILVTSWREFDNRGDGSGEN